MVGFRNSKLVTFCVKQYAESQHMHPRKLLTYGRRNCIVFAKGIRKKTFSTALRPALCSELFLINFDNEK
jgi:hypothetical protein